jgi:uncharacterized OB-fold protein
MTDIAALGTYLPPWGAGAARECGPDEDAVTLGVAAGRAALRAAGGAGDGAPAGSALSSDGGGAVARVVFVTRDLPLLDGGNGAALLAGIGLPADVPVVEQVGGAPAAVEALLAAAPGTLVVAADVAPAGAAAALVASEGTLTLADAGRVTRSLPVVSRGADGLVRDYEDPRLQRERGLGPALAALDLAEKPAAVAGLPARQAAGLCAGRPPELPTLGASAPLFALAALDATSCLLVAVEQASAGAVRVDGTAAVARDERPAQPPPPVTHNPGPEIAISLAAYERAFEPKLRWEAGRCDACGTLALPPRHRCLGCGSEAGWTLTPLPRTGEVYTGVTVHVPVPGLPTPYSLVIVDLDGVDVRALVKVTGVPAGSTTIGDRGSLVLRRVAVRSGIPDYGYALLPASPAARDGGVA